MKKLFSFSFQHKVILILVLFMNVPFFLTGYMAKNLTEQTILREKESKLLALTQILNAGLGPGGYDAILRQAGVENAGRDEKIQALNRALSKISDEVGQAAPGLGAGYYSKDLDAILTYAPAASFGGNVGKSIPPDHPGREVMATNKPMAKFGSMVRGDILNAMLPIERDGKVIGYIWANELTTDITEQFRSMARNIFVVMLLCFIVTVGALFLLSRRTIRDVDGIIKGVRAIRADLSQRIPHAGGELGDVVNSINAMAEDIDKANAESSRAISVLQSVMANVDAAIYVCDPQTRELVYANDYLCKLLDKDDLAGQLCYEVLHNEPAPCANCPQQHLFDAQGNPVFTPVRCETHNKRLKRDFLITSRLVTWHDGRLLHMEVATDVTERNALAMAEAANLAQRDFLARMSHELRTPMNGVLGMTYLAMQADPPPAQLEYLKKIQASAALLLGIINDILDFSRIEAGKLTMEKRSFNIHEMVENIRELILPRITEKNLDFSIHMAESVPEYAVGDGLRLSQVLLNLLGNAAKFTLKGFVSLHITATHPAPGQLRLNCEVRDSGIGMNAEQLKGLFKPFSQADSSTSRKFGGTGLGLSISKALVELMHGAISATSEAGKGSVFSFFVDLESMTGVSELKEEKAKLWEAARYEGRKILLVEDNEINQIIARTILTDLGADVDVAGNGEEGVKAFMNQDYDLVFMDVRMPVLDGLGAAQRIRASRKHDAATVPIIAMTANAMREDREATKNAGMDGHVAKPIDMNELKSVLFQWIKSSNVPMA